ncbi:hypothetical protein [Kitasatospora indigofera]|uniref:hypothetical protein n=1 Tax=Kitasatospora indigofera TaxID=67307 RepID=UPI0036C186CE
MSEPAAQAAVPAPAPAADQAPGANPAPALQRWVWPAMRPEERRQRLEELAVWVDWLIERHQLHRKIPRCWYRDGHEKTLEYLTALYLGWARTYCGDPTKVSTLGELAWLKDLKAVIPDLAAPACDSGHQEPPKRKKPTGEDLADWLDDDPDWVAAPASHPAEAEANRLAAATANAAGAKAAGSRT